MSNKITYSAVVESGSYSPDYKRYEEIKHCGHNHRSYDAAKKCLSNKTKWYCQHDRTAGSSCAKCLGGLARSESTSAAWYNGTIHNQDGERV